jgi:predicted DsbA family dithiol-disulfide isomerase
MTLHVDVVSDLICPWCFIGKRRLEKAIVALETAAWSRLGGWRLVLLLINKST